MKKRLRRILVVVLIIATVVVIIGLVISKPLPEGESGARAEALADSMLLALNKPAYDSIRVLSWSYPKGHHFIWNKQENEVNVRWDAYEVVFSPANLTGISRLNGKVLSGKAHEEAVHKAWTFFANDSFWLVAPFKIRDPGTLRYIVETERGDALLVTYTSGGVTPGDSYLWFLDESYRPVAWQLWVEMLPVNGLEFSWQGWTQQKGAWFALVHKGPKTIHLTNLEVQ